MTDFFISYNRADKSWAEWIAWTLEEAGYAVVIQAWDFRPGGNFILDMHRAASETERTIAVLSETYLKSTFTQPEWAAALVHDPSALERKLIPVKVKACQPTGLLKPICYVDLLGLSAEAARQALLAALPERAKPITPIAFPGDASATTSAPRLMEQPCPFPRALTVVLQTQERGLQQQLDTLIEDYEAVNQQVSATVNAAARLRLQRQLEQITQEMEKLAIALDQLSGTSEQQFPESNRLEQFPLGALSSPVSTGTSPDLSHLSPGNRLKLQDRKHKLAKVEQRIEKLNQEIKAAVDYEIEEKLERRKERAFQDIDRLSQEIYELEKGHV